MTETERYHAAPRLPEDRSTILSTGIHSRSMYETPGVAAYECDLAHRAGVLRTGGSPPLELCAACQRPQSRATYVAETCNESPRIRPVCEYLRSIRPKI